MDLSQENTNSELLEETFCLSFQPNGCNFCAIQSEIFEVAKEIVVTGPAVVAELNLPKTIICVFDSEMKFPSAAGRQILSLSGGK